MEEKNINNLENEVFALCMLATLEAKIASSPKAIAEKLAEIKRNGIKIGQITINRTAGGYFSPLLEEFLGCCIVSGSLEDRRNPILITQSGYEIFKEILSGSDPDRMGPIANAIGMSEIYAKISQ